MGTDLDRVVRVAAFNFLREQTTLHGGSVLPRRILEQGFQLDGRRVPLVAPQGIFKPAVCELPLSITTVPEIPGKERPYEDERTYEGVHYRYRGTDPRHPDNVGLRRAMAEHVPLVYFHGHQPGLYHAEWPAYVVRDDPARLTFTILTEDVSDFETPATIAEMPRRAYLATLMTKRLHQSLFRVRVLDAYEKTCAVCRLRHWELLDAAHILPDNHPLGDPVVPNGLALCKLHHAAFDADILGVRPDLKIEVRGDVLREVDGPMLKVGLQGFDGQVITVPRQKVLRPNTDFLAERYERFRKAG
ncbi:HNH endonuclease [bacterium]|nr:MAG: HNH endonuclease [bacterium]